MKGLLFALLLLTNMSVWAANWAPIGGDDTSDIYVNNASVRVRGRIVTMWTLEDYKVAKGPAEAKVLSVMAQQEDDCDAERFRLLFIVYYSDHMGFGEPVYTDRQPDQWSPLPPGSRAERFWKYACDMLAH